MVERGADREIALIMNITVYGLCLWRPGVRHTRGQSGRAAADKR